MPKGEGVGSDHDSSTQGCGSATGVQVYSKQSIKNCTAFCSKTTTKSRGRLHWAAALKPGYASLG